MTPEDLCALWRAKLMRGEELNHIDLMGMIEVLRVLLKRTEKASETKVDHSSIPNPLENEYQWP